jgi:hypothetical protein
MNQISKYLSKLLPLIICSFLLLPSPALAQSLTGKVVGVSDGDTITVLDSSKRHCKMESYSQRHKMRNRLGIGRLGIAGDVDVSGRYQFV